MSTPASVAAGERVPDSVADCDRALSLLRLVRRAGTVEERFAAQVAIDDVLDRRLELTEEAAT